MCAYLWPFTVLSLLPIGVLYTPYFKILVCIIGSFIWSAFVCWRFALDYLACSLFGLPYFVAIVCDPMIVSFMILVWWLCLFCIVFWRVCARGVPYSVFLYMAHIAYNLRLWLIYPWQEYEGYLAVKKKTYTTTSSQKTIQSSIKAHFSIVSDKECVYNEGIG